MPAEEPAEAGEPVTAAEDDPRNRRRGRRGGRRRRPQNEGELSPFALPGADQPELLPVYAGPTPADPFGGRAFDIFDVMDQAERAAEAKPPSRTATAVEIVNNAAPEPETITAGTQPRRRMKQQRHGANRKGWSTRRMLRRQPRTMRSRTFTWRGRRRSPKSSIPPHRNPPAKYGR